MSGIMSPAIKGVTGPLPRGVRYDGSNDENGGTDIPVCHGSASGDILL